MRVPERGPMSQQLFDPLIAKLAEISRTLDELQMLVNGRREAVLSLVKTTALLSREQAADRLNISLSQLDRETKKGALPQILVDRRPRYSLLDLETYVNSRRSNPRFRKTPEKPN